MPNARIVLTTVSDPSEAERIAHALVDERLAACVNCIASVRSVYRWQDAVDSAEEVLLLIKTEQQRLPALEARIRELHSYELPEFLVLDIAGGSDAYLAWIAAGLR